MHNLQRAAFLAAALFSGKPEFHPFLFDDRWHQPFRARLMPGLAEVLRFSHPDVLGICLSGAGPSILAFVHGSPAAISDELLQVLARSGVQAQAAILTADNLGAKGYSFRA